MARNRAVPDCRAQCLRREFPLQPQRNPRARRRRQDVPRLGLPVRQADGVCEFVIRVNLDRQGLAGEQQLEQERRAGRTLVDTPKPQLTDRISRSVDAAPGTQIDAAPGFAGDLDGGMLDGHPDRLKPADGMPAATARARARSDQGPHHFPQCPRPEPRDKRVLAVERDSKLVLCTDDALDRRKIQFAERIVLTTEQALFADTMRDRGDPDIHHLAANERLDRLSAIPRAQSQPVHGMWPVIDAKLCK
ncbi:hypothetical protein ABIE86_005830 [Bradyrhizobium diazoefficiens]